MAFTLVCKTFKVMCPSDVEDKVADRLCTLVATAMDQVEAELRLNVLDIDRRLAVIVEE